MLPNTDQVLSLVRSVLTIVGAMLIAKGLVSTADWTTYAGAILAVVPPVWGLFAHTDAAKLKSVEAMPEVIKIDVTALAANSAAGLAAADFTRKKVAFVNQPNK